MSNFTTGEVAKICGVTVRTVQYYDTKGILIPSSLSEGGRRLYSEDDLEKMKIICFLKELGLPLNSIAELMKEESPEHVVTLLLEQQEKSLTAEILDKKEKLDKVKQLQSGLKQIDTLSVKSIGDVAYRMKNKKQLFKVRRNMLIIGLIIDFIEYGTIIFGFLEKNWIPALIGLPFCILMAVFITRYYFKNTAYICPECHTIFRPKGKEAFFAKHTPNTRKCTCTACGHHGFCVEVYYDPNQEE